MSSFLYRQQHSEPITTRIGIIHRHDNTAEEARKYICNIYKKNYNAVINPDPDIIITSRDIVTGELVACTGISFAAPSLHLFSERYLDGPLEEVIFQQTDLQLARYQIAEVGSLASDNPNAAADLIRLMPIITWFMGCKAVLCTSTRRLRRLLSFHQVPYLVLADASPEMLSAEEKVAWGSYYEQTPQTGVVMIDQCGHLFDHFCGRLVFSDFESLINANLATSDEAA